MSIGNLFSNPAQRDDMFLIPQVKSYIDRGGTFHFDHEMKIYLQNKSTDLIFCAELLRQRIAKWTGIDLPVEFSNSGLGEGVHLNCKKGDSNEKYVLSVSAEQILIQGSTENAVFWAVQTLSQIVQQENVQIPCFEITDFPDFANRGFYHDVTRGKVPSLQTLKWLVEKLAFYKINQLQLYVEHTFAFSGIPELWTGKDPLTAEEILELDAWCCKFHVELVPSMATFGHLYELLRLKRFEHLNELDIKASELPHNLWDRMAHYTIDPCNGESLKLIKSMIEQYIPLFSSRYFNICCDETFDLGKGKNKSRVESGEGGRLYVDFVKKIAGIVTAYDKIPMMWGDIILHYPELIGELPENTIYLNWGYGADITDENVKKFARKGVAQYVCPGTQGWSRFAYDIDCASQNIRKMITFGGVNGAQGVLNTDWGDCGHVNNISGALHGMILGAALSWKRDSFPDDEEFDKAASVIEWDESSGELCGQLRRLGSLCPYHFGNLYAWAYGVEGLWNRELLVKELDFSTLSLNFRIAGEIRDFLVSTGNLCSGREFDEFVLSADAMRWTLGLLMFKKVNEYGQAGVVTWNREDLIRTGYAILNEFIKLWRLRNKESELSSVVNTFRRVMDKILCINGNEPVSVNL